MEEGGGQGWVGGWAILGGPMRRDACCQAGAEGVAEPECRHGCALSPAVPSSCRHPQVPHHQPHSLEHMSSPHVDGRVAVAGAHDGGVPAVQVLDIVGHTLDVPGTRGKRWGVIGKRWGVIGWGWRYSRSGSLQTLCRHRLDTAAARPQTCRNPNPHIQLTAGGS